MRNETVIIKLARSGNIKEVQIKKFDTWKEVKETFGEERGVQYINHYWRFLQLNRYRQLFYEIENIV